jgi:hypothetical protein
MMNAIEVPTIEADDLLNAFYNGPVERMGVYEANGQVFVVKPNQAKTRLYAKVWANGHLDYVAGAIYRLHPCHKVSRERGEELSLQIGACCVCGRTLTDPKSVRKGIGPVCGKAFDY